MAKVGISISLDVTKIDKSRIFVGKKGKYLDLTMFVDLDEQDQYGNNGPVSQTVSKDEQGQGVKLPILGNCKIFWQGEGERKQNNQQPQSNPIPDDTDCPF